MQRLHRSSIRVELAAALADWALLRKRSRKKGDTTPEALLALARAVAPDGWPAGLFTALEQQDFAALKKLTTSERAADLPPATPVRLGSYRRRTGEAARGGRH